MFGKPAFQVFVELLSKLSLRNQYRFGDLMALIIRLFPNQISRQTRENIGLCFPELNAAEQKKLVAQSISHTCYTMTELGAVWCWPADSILARINQLDVCPEFNRTSGSRIILAPHLGSWETLAVWLGRGSDALMLYRRRDNRKLDEFIRKARSRSGGEPVSTKKKGLRRLLVGLNNAEHLMILPDQKPGGNKSKIDASFFGASAPTTKLVNMLCSKVKCEVFLATVTRSSPPGHFALRIEHIEHARLAGDESESAQYMNDLIEARCRDHPEQYQWGYRRFTSAAYRSLNPGSRHAD